MYERQVEVPFFFATFHTSHSPWERQWHLWRLTPQWLTFPRNYADRRKAAVSRRKRWLVEKTPAGSGFAAALVDVVLHEGNDLLELVVQLSAPCCGVRLQSAHHLNENTTKMTFSGCRAFMHPSDWQREEISHLLGHRKLDERVESSRGTTGVPQPLPTACTHASTPQKLFALHVFTKPTSALLFMPKSCHRFSGIYGLLAAVCYQAERTELGRENRQSRTIHRALWIRV